MTTYRKLARFSAVLAATLGLLVGVAHAVSYFTTINSNCGTLATISSVPLQIACMRAMEWPTAYYGCSDLGNGAAECNPAFGSTSVPKVRVSTCNSNADVFTVPGYGTFVAGYKCVSGLSNPPGYSWNGGSQSRNVWKGTVPTNQQLLVYKNGDGAQKSVGYPGCCGASNQLYTVN
jgi:hypothetical protein